MSRRLSRRQWLVHAGAGLAAAAACPSHAARGGRVAAERNVLGRIESEIVRLEGAEQTTWFSARACTVPEPAGRTVLLLLQPIYGSDFFGPVHWTATADLGRTWTAPQPIPSLGRRRIDAQIEEGVCDVVPEYHAPTCTVLAIGHNVFYRPQGFFRPQPPRWPVYVVRSADGHWSTARRLEWNDPRGSDIYTCNCAQRSVLDNGDLLIPFSFRPQGRPDAAVATAAVAFDGRELKIVRMGPELRLNVARGLLEPSVVRHGGRYFLTLRAEDERGYVTASDDGLHWAPIRPWCWDDGEPLVMSTTQQRWLPHREALYLVYTRKSAENARLFRWRAPLYVAQVDRCRRCLIRATERIAMPLVGDAVGHPKDVEQLGNFHTVAAAAGQSWITVGAFAPSTYRGPLRISRVFWTQPNAESPATPPAT
jgi:hypothetical protein